jgi:hypothetical protein
MSEAVSLRRCLPSRSLHSDSHPNPPVKPRKTPINAVANVGGWAPRHSYLGRRRIPCLCCYGIGILSIVRRAHRPIKPGGIRRNRRLSVIAMSSSSCVADWNREGNEGHGFIALCVNASNLGDSFSVLHFMWIVIILLDTELLWLL